MLVNDSTYTDYDLSAIKVLKDFIPDKVFDVHAHLFDSRFLPNVHPASYGAVVGDIEAYQKAMAPMLCNPKELRANIIIFPDKAMANNSNGTCAMSDSFLVRELEKSSDNMGEIIVSPHESAEDIEKRLVHPRIRGLKCYHYMNQADVTWNLSIGEYLPESAWEVAQKHKLCITLHMVKDHALADKDNMEYICAMAKKYPDVVLILAHAARSFAAWTAIESVGKIARFENVWFDFSANCESPAMFKIMQKVGVERCMWGSDYPVSAMHGKAISIGDTFHWIYESECDGHRALPKKFWLIGIENLMALRQACLLAELSKSDIEKLFYHNAMSLFGL